MTKNTNTTTDNKKRKQLNKILNLIFIILLGIILGCSLHYYSFKTSTQGKELLREKSPYELIISQGQNLNSFINDSTITPNTSIDSLK